MAKYSDEEKTKIAKLRAEENMKYVDIKRKYNVCPESVKRWIKKYLNNNKVEDIQNTSDNIDYKTEYLKSLGVIEYLENKILTSNNL